jgi:cullin-associated NEDD8-dissociated protein 1
MLVLYPSVLESLVDPLQKTINFKPKQDAVKQEVDRNEDMIRSALRAIASLNRIRFCSLLYLDVLFDGVLIVVIFFIFFIHF